MSESYFFSNFTLVENGDFFKIMETRYPHSLFDKDGNFNTTKLVSNSLELVLWLRNCETYFQQLLAEDTPKVTVDQFIKELKELMAPKEIFENFGITEISTLCKWVYQTFELEKFKLASSGFIKEIVGYKDLDSWYESLFLQRAIIKSEVQSKRCFELDPDKQEIYDDLVTFLKGTNPYHFLALDIEVTAPALQLQSRFDWFENAEVLKLIFEKALNNICISRSDVLRYYVKLEDSGCYGQRFHTIIFLNNLTLTEQAWIHEFEQLLLGTLNQQKLIEALIIGKNEERIKSHTHQLEVLASIDPKNNLIDSKPTLINYENFSAIKFDLTNWNDRLLKFFPDLKFKITSQEQSSDIKRLEYWGVKYLFLSEKYIYMNHHNDSLNPTISHVVNLEIEKKYKAQASVIESIALAKDERPHLENRSPNQKGTNSGGLVEVRVEPKRRVEYIGFFDGSSPLPLIKGALPQEKHKFEKKEFKADPEISGQPPSSDLMINTPLCKFQDFLKYSFGEKIVKIELKDKQRVKWAEIFYKHAIHDEELSNFLIDFEHLLDYLLYSKNPYFAHLPSDRNCMPKDMSVIGQQYLRLFIDFYQKQIVQKIEKIGIDSSHWKLIFDFFMNNFEERPNADILQVVMYKERINSLNNNLKNAQILVKEQKNKLRKNLLYLNYIDTNVWKRAFDQERFVMRYCFTLPLRLDNEKIKNISQIFDYFKKQLSGSVRHFKSVNYISRKSHREELELLDVLFMFDNAKGAEDQKWLNTHIIDLWGKSVSANIKDKLVDIPVNELKRLARQVEFIKGHEQLDERYLHINDCKDAEAKLVSSYLIPYFISRAIFLQDVSSGKTDQLGMSRNLSNLFKIGSSDKKKESLSQKKVLKSKKINEAG
ncbi:hypothetical protein F901_00856 [Acinetobacter dispersus]|uniref:hypothetical protein n=1 Tax=Acinetobacter dispersus TaxID=70348 RepID=UPI0002CE51E6|nr:hypothetical protein [Acinetobacter dispersus]ENX53590.1 hypothetical protein F901_00856 [Acinetobacter dispersus]